MKRFIAVIELTSCSHFCFFLSPEIFGFILLCFISTRFRIKSHVQYLSSPGHRFQLVKKLAVHHGDLVNDEVLAGGPVLKDPGPLSQLDALLQWGRARTNTCQSHTADRLAEERGGGGGGIVIITKPVF